MGRSERVRGRGKGFEGVGAGTGSIITGGSSTGAPLLPRSRSSPSGLCDEDSDVVDCDGKVSRSPPSRSAFFFPGLAESPEEEDAMLAVLAAGSLMDLERSRVAFWRNLGNLLGWF